MTTQEKLLVPLPMEALKQHPTRTYLTSINSIYVTERLNNVFGLAGWKTTTNVIKDDGKWVVVQMFFTAADGDSDGLIEHNAFGGNDNEDIGDRYKGAATDALTKIGSFMGIGSHVWMNKDVPGRSASPNTRSREEHPASPSDVASRSNTAVPTGEPTEWLNVLGRDGEYTDIGLEYAERVYAKEMSVKDVRKLFMLSRKGAEALESWSPPTAPSMDKSPLPPNDADFNGLDDGLPF